jgi:hypothetical protein
MENIKMHKIQFMNYENIMAKSNYKTLCDYKKFGKTRLSKGTKILPKVTLIFPKPAYAL